MDCDRRILRDHRILSRENLGNTDVLVPMNYLPLQVGIIHQIIVDHPDGANASRCKILQRRRAQPASANHQDTGVFQLFLPRPAQFA